MHKAVVTLVALLSTQTWASNTTSNLFDLSLEELLQVRIGSLTETDINMVPASVTIISALDIAHSGARSMYELLDIKVPNLQIVNHNFGTQHIGIRGIINDRDTTYLTLLNGKVLNHKSKLGATTELDLPMLSDIKEITVVRGAGSAIYGPGAIAGIISIKTFDGANLPNNKLTYRKGIEEQFNAYELNYKTELGSQNRHLFVSYGYSDYKGASSSSAPYYVSSNTTLDGESYQQAGHPVPYNIPNDKENSDDQGKHKLHIEITGESHSLWFRLAQGGYQSVNEKGNNESEFTRGNQRHKHNKYQQYTLFFEQSINAPLDGTFKYNISAQVTEAGRTDDKTTGNTYDPLLSTSSLSHRSQFVREDEFLINATYSVQSDSIKSVSGVEYTTDTFGKNGFSDSDIISSSSGVYPDGNFHNDTDVFLNGEWTINTLAAFSEIQADLSNNTTGFFSIRLDKHDYTDWYVSPRASLVYQYNDQNVFKGIINQSVKRASEIDMRIAYLEDEKAVEEQINSIELIHETIRQDNLNYKTAVFYQDVEFWSFNQGENTPVGSIAMMGAEFEFSYKTEDHQLTLSHSYTKLTDAENTSDNQYITAEPFGYGDDLNTWSNHLTKLNYAWQIKESWLFTSSLRMYWGFDGAQDYGDYNNEEGSNSSQHRFGYDDNGEAFDGNYYLNFGLHKTINDKLTVNISAYNTLGLFDKKLSKRNYLKRFGDYRAEAIALSLNVNYTF